MSVRYAHTDVTVPDFDEYRIKTSSSQSISDFRKNERQRRVDKKSFDYAITGKLSILLYIAYILVVALVSWLCSGAFAIISILIG